MTDFPNLDRGEFQRPTLASMQQEVKQLGARIVSLERQAYLPVSIPYRVGEQTAEPL